MRYTKYKKYYKISCFGNNDIWANRADSQYRTTGSNFTNGKTCRFNFNGAFNDVILSKNAHIILESAYFPTVTNIANYVNIRIVTSTEDEVFDTLKQKSGNPIIVTFPGANQTIINGSELFYNFSVPSSFLSKGYIDIEIESPIVSAAVTFTGTVLNRLLLTFVIVDQDEEEVQDTNLASNVEYKNYGRLGMPIRTPLT
jgi:hypothetical protein